MFLRELQQGPAQEAAIEVRITGELDKVLERPGGQVENVLSHSPGALDVHNDWRGVDAYRLKVNVRQEVANRLGFTNAGIGRELAGSSMGTGYHLLGG